ncbi:serine/threonine-protein kinase [Streptomyces albus]|uniref:serine/threonine-protein kinase n=1 Tax=Streptomyces albus TaxID=1888 RepID=UPI0006901FA7|nr:serine/threonine-protein kinase [Streptomyces albus]
MKNDGGRADEPTSYLIPPPGAPAAGPAGAPAPGQDGAPGTPRPGAAPQQEPGQEPAQEPAQASAPHQASAQEPAARQAPAPRHPLAPHPAPGAPAPASGAPHPEPGTPAPVPTEVVATPPPRAAHGAGAGTAGPAPGRTIGGRYRLLSRLGHGGMGTVWRARDEVVDRDVAVKEPRVPDQLSEQERQTVYQRMRREARSAAAIDHPSVVTVHDVVVEDGRPWIVMELVRGQSLGDRLGEGTLDPREAARIGLAVLGALTAAHEAGVLHRDVKPDNVLLGRHDRVVLTDFGIAQVEGEQRLTETGAFLGSPEYIAPERVLGQLPGPESDLWSLGVLLYAAVEGMSPYRRSNTPATLQAVLSAEPPAPARGAGALGHLVMQLLRKDPAARPAPAEIRQTLESVARPPQPPALPQTRAMTTGGPGGPRGLLRTTRGRAGLGGGLLAAVLALVLVIANPFAADGPPEDWRVREEGEIVKASLFLPPDYERTDSEEGYVTFADPSGVYTVELWRDQDTGEPGDTPNADSAEKAAEELVTYYGSGAENSVQEARSTTRQASQQERKAVQVFTTFRDYGAREDDITRHFREHVYVNADKVVWRLRVRMPAEGHARPEGEKLFDEIVRHLEIQEL